MVIRLFLRSPDGPVPGVGAQPPPQLHDLGVDRSDPMVACHADAVVAVPHEVLTRRRFVSMSLLLALLSPERALHERATSCWWVRRDASVGLGALIVVGALVVVAVCFRVVIMWLYNGSGRSVLVVALFHSAYNSAWGTGDKNFTNELLSGSALPYAVVAVAVVAVVVAAVTRGRLAYEPPSARDRDRPRRRGRLLERDAHLPGGVAGVLVMDNTASYDHDFILDAIVRVPWK